MHSIIHICMLFMTILKSKLRGKEIFKWCVEQIDVISCCAGMDIKGFSITLTGKNQAFKKDDIQQSEKRM